MLSQRLLLTGAGVCLAIGAGAAPAQAQSAYSRDHNISVQDRANSEHAPLGIGLGSFLLFPQLDLGVEKNDNIFASPVNETDDTILTAGASARLASQWSRHGLNFFGGVQSRTFSDNGDDDVVGWRARGDGHLNILSDIRLEGHAFTGRENESRFASNGPPDLLEPIEYDVDGYGLGLVRDVNRFRAAISMSQSNFDYKDGVRVGNIPFDQDTRDNDALDLKARLDYAISPDTAIFAQVSRLTRDYDIDTPTDRDSEGWRYLVGTNFDITSVVRGEVAIGHSETDYDDPTLANADGISGFGQIEWFVTNLTTLSANASRETIDSAIVTSSGIERTSYGVRADHELRRDIVLTGGYMLDQDEYLGLARDDDYSRFDVGMDWYMNRFVKIGASYERFKRDSTDPTIDFTANVFALRASLRR